MELKWRSTGIPKINKDVAQILDMPMRDTKVTTQLDEDFPGTTIKSNTLEVIVVGAGWRFVTNALGLIAGGATIVAYENDIERTAAGKVDSAEITQYFEFYLAHTETLLMPEFTSEQLTRLPVVITTIADDPQYQALMDKRRRILSLGRVKYEDLPVSDKISIIEVTEMKRRIIKLLGESGVLKIINQEVTIDHIKMWVEANKPVFLITGEQIDLESQDLAHFDGVPGFVKEFLSGSAPVESLINEICGRQCGLRSDTEMTGTSKIPDDCLPSVAILGSGKTALQCTRDLLDRVNPKLLQVTFISLEQPSRLSTSLIQAQRSMMYRSLPGYVSKVVLSGDGSTVDSVQVVSHPDGSVQELRPSLFIHTHNERSPLGTWDQDFCHARDSITRLLDERACSNGLVRDGAIAPLSEVRNIHYRVTESWDASLDDDLELKVKIENLVGDAEATIVVSGGNAMINCAIWFAASLGYRGSIVQVSMPLQDPREVDLAEALARKNFVCEEVNGRLACSEFDGSKFSFHLHGPEEKSRTTVVDYVVNATGRTNRTPLIKAMIKNGYIGEDDDGDLFSQHPTLSAHYTVFSGMHQYRVNSPSIRYIPFSNERQIEPWGWEAAFDFAKANTPHSPSARDSSFM